MKDHITADQYRVFKDFIIALFRSEIEAAMPDHLEVLGSKFKLDYESKQALRQYRSNLLKALEGKK